MINRIEKKEPDKPTAALSQWPFFEVASRGAEYWIDA